MNIVLPISKSRLRLVCDAPQRIDRAIAELEKSPLIANDIETIPYRKTMKGSSPERFVMTMASYSCLSGDFVFPFYTGKTPVHGIQPNVEAIYKGMRHINALSIPHVGQNFSYDAQWYLRYDLPVKNWAFDTMVMFWSRYPELPKDLAFIASILLDDYQYWKDGLKSREWMDQLDYAMNDTWNTLRICIQMLPWILEHQWIRRNFLDAMLRCYAATGMNAFGSHVDESALDDMRGALTEQAAKALEELRYMIADPEFNPNSVPQKKELLYGILGSEWKNAKGRITNKFSKASTGAHVLRMIKQEGVIQRRVITGIEKAIEPAKQISNVINMPHLPLPSGNRRFLTFFDGVGTITTRYASRSSTFGHGTNAQNIRKEYRRLLASDSGHFYLEVDFSGADAVFIAFEAEEENLIKVFQEGKDLHAHTAANLFPNWTYEQVVAGKEAKDPRVVHPITGIRQATKKIGHGANYLMMGYTLLMTATIPTIIAAAKEEGHHDSYLWDTKRLVLHCDSLDTRYRNLYPRLRRSGSGSWYGDIYKLLNDVGRVETIYGFTLPLLGDLRDDSTLRVAAATYGQANTAGRTNAALYELRFGIRTYRFRDDIAPDYTEPPLQVLPETHGIYIIRQVHDSLIFQCEAKHPNLREGLDRIFHVIRRPFVCKGRTFSLGVEAEVGLNWAYKTKTVDSSEQVLAWVKENFNEIHK